ncbi:MULTISPECIES: glyoxylate/hydroxypyruvate reductase A [unclassified Colwellia]|uniref:2-hydroxyacid dehydrogenase n=1 Tax=unclassified Colwellia TaxID=196834 RepID=UPI0015F4461F|nr:MULTISPECIES: glyoxylate/hydroxypyruvate reductase A [unclassified Colwellia]MBA6353218.1 glyoxylate/hydroxypyruvate reductase A [Colwellia sp. BRX9-1]MBA6380167.1 glyoxylate/hydroxypyruvate reductase A [Colwellia sp. BRX10-7]MBA6387379.1 glyoxylate/hydroxypyruvate reductase A [Colwellia sp. BRX10-2]MBA6402466.1 glyoxylate/hydroxypyruvate reductase A [Colwellia sp. BRX10-5]MBA6406602.1 glyoxylate/hydroxypyruvate reductase A [Colwellia sp. BRX10-1]
MAVITFVSQLAHQEQDAWLALLSTKLPNEAIKLDKDLSVEQKLQCEIAIVANPDANILSQYPKLIWVQSLWAGVDALVSQLSDNKPTPSFKLVRLIDPILAQTMSEAVLTWVLYLHRDMPKYLQQQKSAQWLQHRYLLPQERTLGILGLGQLGKLSALRLHENGFNVLGWSQSDKLINGITCYSGDEGLVTMVRQTDILICLLPLTSATYQLINDDLLTNLPQGASIINFARGGIVANHDLINHLANGNLEHAILDVFEQEPLDKSDDLWSNEKITVLPHISAPTHFESAGEIVTKNIKQYRSNDQIPFYIDWNKGY